MDGEGWLRHPPFEGRAKRLRRNRLLLGFTAGVGLVGSAMVLSGAKGPAGFFLTFWGTIMTAAVLVRNPFPRKIEQGVRADAKGLWFDGILELPRASIVQAYLQPGAHTELGLLGAVVRIVGRGARDATFVMPYEGAAALLAALGLDASSRTAVILGRSPLALARAGRIPIPYLVFPFFILSYFAALLFSSWLGLFGSFSAVLYWLLSAIPCRIHVGADGVLRSWLGLRCFVAYREIARVEGKRTRRVDVTLHRLDGSTLELAARKRYDPEAGQGADDRALLHRIEEGVRVHARGASSADALALLERGQRGAAAWLESLRAVCASSGIGYRASALSGERLLCVLEDPSATPTLRVGAAAALAITGGDQGKWREDLRRVAGACAHPEVRVALERLAAGDADDEWAGALESIGEELTGPRAAPRGS